MLSEIVWNAIKARILSICEKYNISISPTLLDDIILVKIKIDFNQILHDISDTAPQQLLKPFSQINGENRKPDLQTLKLEIEDSINQTLLKNNQDDWVEMKFLLEDSSNEYVINKDKDIETTLIDKNSNPEDSEDEEQIKTGYFYLIDEYDNIIFMSTSLILLEKAKAQLETHGTQQELSIVHENAFKDMTEHFCLLNNVGTDLLEIENSIHQKLLLSILKIKTDSILEIQKRKKTFFM